MVDFGHEVRVEVFVDFEVQVVIDVGNSLVFSYFLIVGSIDVLKVLYLGVDWLVNVYVLS